MAKSFPVLGVVGGGQLARMLAPACNNHDVQMTILDPSNNSPAGQVAFDQIVGELDDPAALQLLCERSDIVTFDIENVGADILMALADQRIEIVPAPEAGLIQTVRPKVSLPRFLESQPILPFLLRNQVSQMLRLSVLPCVQKAHTGGYDGRGVHIIRSKEDWKIV